MPVCASIIRAAARDLAELALAHTLGNATEQSYARGSQVTKRRPMMQAWNDFVTA
jgi:hypothetical protein